MQLQPNGAGKLIMTLDAKDFTLGLSPLQQAQNTTGGFFATAQAIDPYRFPGMICPGPLPTAYSGNAHGGGAITIAGVPWMVDIIDKGIFDGFIFTDAGNLYHIDSQGNILNGSFDGGLNYWPDLNIFSGITGSLSYSHSMVKGGSTGTELFIFYDQNIFWWSATAINRIWATDIPTGKAYLNSGCIHRAVVYNKLCYFTNGQYIGTIDFTTSPYTLNNSAFALPLPYQGRDIKIENGNIVIYCDSSGGALNGFGKCSIVTWDGNVQNTLPDMVELDDSIMLGAETINGFPTLMTKGRGLGKTIGVIQMFSF